MWRFGPAAPRELLFPEEIPPSSSARAGNRQLRRRKSGENAGERAGGGCIPAAGLIPARTSWARSCACSLLPRLLGSAETPAAALTHLKLPLLLLERFIRNNSSTSFSLRVEVLQEGKKVPEAKGKRAQLSSSPHFSFLSRHFVGQRERVCAVFGLWWCTVKAAAAICSVMKQGAAMAPKGLVYSTNLPSTHFLLRILTPNLIVKSRIDWKMQMAI